MQVSWILNGEKIIKHQMTNGTGLKAKKKNSFYFSSEDENSNQRVDSSQQESESDSSELPDLREVNIDEQYVAGSLKKRKRNKKYQEQEESSGEEENYSLKQRSSENKNPVNLTSRQQAILLKQQFQNQEANSNTVSNNTTKKKSFGVDTKIKISLESRSPSQEKVIQSPTHSEVPSQNNIVSQSQNIEEAPKFNQRKEVAQEKIQNKTKEAIDKILRDQGRKVKKIKDNQVTANASTNKLTRSQLLKPQGPCLIYKSNAKNTYINVPPAVNLNHLLNSQQSSSFQVQQKNETELNHEIESTKCCMCGRPKKYKCSKTNRFLCSLECYKQNLQRSFQNILLNFTFKKQIQLGMIQ